MNRERGEQRANHSIRLGTFRYSVPPASKANLLLKNTAVQNNLKDLLLNNNFLNKFASSTMKCNTWESRKGDAILSVYAKDLPYSSLPLEGGGLGRGWW